MTRTRRLRSVRAPGARVPHSTRQRAWQTAVRRWGCDERGAAIVEFAIVVPILLVLVMAIIDFGRMLAVAASLAAAVRDGARQAATIGDLNDASQFDAVRVRVAAEFQPLGGMPLSQNSIGIYTDANHNFFAVRVSGYTYQPITPIAKLIGMGTITLTRQAAFRWERVQ